MFMPEKKEVATEVQLLLTMLTYKRRDGTEGEEAFVDRFVRPLMDHPNATDGFEDEYGNVFVEVAGGSKLLITAHTDTVHPVIAKGVNYHQQVMYDSELGIIYKDDKYALGADDGSGVWMATQMLDAAIPCWLAFFRGEEVGGLGSSWASKSDPTFFKKFDMAVAFDRRGTGDIITHQGGSRCASEAWAKALATQFNDMGLDYAPCDGGVFTDTANLTELVPECTNLSVGYDHEHSGNETQDVGHLLKLRDAVLKVDWLALPIERDPSVVEYIEDDAFGSSWGGYRNVYGFKSKYKPLAAPTTTKVYEEDLDDGYEHIEYIPDIVEDDLYGMNLREMIEAAQDFPEDFATAVYQMVWGKLS